MSGLGSIEGQRPRCRASSSWGGPPIHRPRGLPCVDAAPAAWPATRSGRLVLARRLEGRLGGLNTPSKIRGPPWREAPDQLTHSPLTFARKRDDLGTTL